MMSDVPPATPVSAVATPSAPRLHWLRRRDVVFVLSWSAIQGLINLAIYPFLPLYADPALNKLAWKLRAVIRQYEERRVAPKTLATATASVSQTSGPEWPLPYRLMQPPRARNERYPLVVFLHGSGERGHENLRQLQSFPAQMSQTEWRSRFRCFVVAPQCPPDVSWGHTEVRDSVIAMIDELLREFPSMDRRRIYLTGLSMGGYGSWALAAHRPDLFAAVVPICGGGNVEDAPKLIHTPLWAVHGDADTVVPVSGSRDMIAAIRKAGGQPNYSELKGVGHDAWSSTYNDPEGLVTWMFSQVSSPSTP